MKMTKSIRLAVALIAAAVTMSAVGLEFKIEPQPKETATVEFKLTADEVCQAIKDYVAKKYPMADLSSESVRLHWHGEVGPWCGCSKRHLHDFVWDPMHQPGSPEHTELKFSYFINIAPKFGFPENITNEIPAWTRPYIIINGTN